MSRKKPGNADQQLVSAPVMKIDKTQTAAGSQSLFFSSSNTREFAAVLREVQAHISSQYAGLITDGSNGERKEQIKRYIAKYLQDNRVAVAGMTENQLTDALYTEMAEFSFLTKYIFGEGIEEIDGATRS
ncbi:hypothetical protein CLFS41_24110 [Clostridium sp. FS41]|nr:hypothetical protein CLFS41_24110 [Clostridium sp. FS41]